MRPLYAAVLAGLVAATAGASALAYAKQIGPGEARDSIARLIGAPRDAVHIVSIDPGPLGGDAVVVAQMNVPFQLHQEKSGEWRVASVRLRDGRWEDVEMLRKALDAEKTARARSDLSALAAGVEAFHRDRGFYPTVDSCAALVDLIAPAYMPTVIRQDPWNSPYAYQTTPNGYVLTSNGPDGKSSTPDDIAVSAQAGASR